VVRLNVIVSPGKGEGPGTKGCGDVKISSDRKRELGPSYNVRNRSVILHFRSFFRLNLKKFYVLLPVSCLKILKIQFNAL
jgi:hypothetical protein